MAERLMERIRRPRHQVQVGKRVGEGRILINESVSDDDGEIPTQTYLYRLYGNSSLLSYHRETARTLITTPGVLQGGWNREASLRRLDDMDEAESLEKAFLVGDRVRLEQFRRFN